MRGGKRPGAGRKPGAANKRTREIADRAAEEGVTPLEYMLRVMGDENADQDRRDRMALAAAPFVHARISMVQVQPPDGGMVKFTLDLGPRPSIEDE